MSSLHVTSGAATVLAKRRRTDAQARTTGGAPAAASASSSSVPSGTGCGAAAGSTAAELEANDAASAAVAGDRDDPDAGTVSLCIVVRFPYNTYHVRISYVSHLYHHAFIVAPDTCDTQRYIDRYNSHAPSRKLLVSQNAIQVPI